MSESIYSDEILLELSDKACNFRPVFSVLSYAVVEIIRDVYEMELSALREELGQLKDVRAQNDMLCAEITELQKRNKGMDTWRPVDSGFEYKCRCRDCKSPGWGWKLYWGYGALGVTWADDQEDEHDAYVELPDWLCLMRKVDRE